jgi:hypothetical protein
LSRIPASLAELPLRRKPSYIGSLQIPAQSLKNQVTHLS